MKRRSEWGDWGGGRTDPLGEGVPLTGWAAANGIECKLALEMASEEINTMDRILGRPVEPVFEDTKEQGADNMIPAMQRLIDRRGVHAIINGYNTGARVEATAFLLLRGERQGSSGATRCHETRRDFAEATDWRSPRYESREIR